jgi:hypothetical protein
VCLDRMAIGAGKGGVEYAGERICATLQVWYAADMGVYGNGVVRGGAVRQIKISGRVRSPRVSV